MYVSTSEINLKRPKHQFSIVTAQPQPQPNSTSTRVGVDKVIIWTTTRPPVQLLRHFQTTQEADFRYAT